MLWHTPMAWKSANLTLGAWVKNLTNEEYSHLKFDLVKQTTTRLSRVYLIK
jgi:iron complex outermembrane receptor protein